MTPTRGLAPISPGDRPNIADRDQTCNRSSQDREDAARDRAGELIFQAMIHQTNSGLPPEATIAPFRRSVLVQQVLAYLRQVEKRRRTLDQFQSVFAAVVRPPVAVGLVEEVAEVAGAVVADDETLAADALER